MIKSLKLITMITCLLFSYSAQVSAKECKGMNKTSCSSASTCSWVSGYKTKAGVSVDGYCRNKMSKKAATDKVKKDVVNKSVADKAKAKAKAKADKAAIEKAKAKAKADQAKKAKAKAKADKAKATISK